MTISKIDFDKFSNCFGGLILFAAHFRHQHMVDFQKCVQGVGVLEHYFRQNGVINSETNPMADIDKYYTQVLVPKSNDRPEVELFVYRLG